MTSILADEEAWVIQRFRAELSALPEIAEPLTGRREQVAPGVWVVRFKRWQPASFLDRLAEMPEPQVEYRDRIIPVFDWHEGAACAGAGWEAFFGKDDAISEPSFSLRDLRNAQRACRPCPQLRECFVHSLTHEGKGESHGVWGGMSGRQRKPILKALADMEPAEKLAAVRRVTEEWLGTL